MTICTVATFSICGRKATNHALVFGPMQLLSGCSVQSRTWRCWSEPGVECPTAERGRAKRMGRPGDESSGLATKIGSVSMPQKHHRSRICLNQILAVRLFLIWWPISLPLMGSCLWGFGWQTTLTILRALLDC